RAYIREKAAKLFELGVYHPILRLRPLEHVTVRIRLCRVPTPKLGGGRILNCLEELKNIAFHILTQCDTFLIMVLVTKISVRRHEKNLLILRVLKILPRDNRCRAV